MGVYDRDYYRNDPPGGGVLGGVAPVCKWLIAINIAVFVLQMLTDDPRTGLGGVTEWLSLSYDDVVRGFQFWRFLTCAFCHDTHDLMHVVFNMLGLWIFGSNMEPIYGSREFLRFYLTGAFVSAVGHLVFQFALGLGGTMVGASGAVMAVMMLCALYYPSMKMSFMFFFPLELRWLVVLYVVYDMFPVLTALGGGIIVDRVAHAAHLSGLAYGYLYMRYDLRYSRLLAGWSWPRWKRLVKTATRRKPENVRLYEPPNDAAATPDLKVRVDEILAKISAHGEASLTEQERELLKEASRRYKKR